MKLNEIKLLEEEHLINGFTRKQAENSVKSYDDHRAEMTRSVSKKITAAQRKVHDVVKAEQDRLMKMSAKQLADLGEKPSKKTMSKESQVRGLLGKKFSAKDLETYLTVNTTDFHGAGRTEWNQSQHEVESREALKQFKALKDGVNEAQAVGSPLEAIMNAVDAAMAPRGSTLLVFEFDGEEDIHVEVVYDFPEHRSGLGQEVKSALRGLGKVRVEKLNPNGSRGPFAQAYDLKFDEPIEDDRAVTQAVMTKYKSRMAD